MIKLGFGIAAVVCILAAGILLWLSPVFPEQLPHHAADWAVAWFGLFRNPAAAAVLLSGSLLLLVSAMCLSDILVGILFSFLAALFAIACLLGVLALRFDGVATSMEHLLK